MARLRVYFALTHCKRTKRKSVSKQARQPSVYIRIRVIFFIILRTFVFLLGGTLNVLESDRREKKE
jgi:hypothetical protein